MTDSERGRSLAGAWAGIDRLEGAPLIRASWIGTLVFVVVSGLGVALVDQLGSLVVVADLVIFAAGVVVFAVAFIDGANRSRTHELGIGGWFFLAGSAPKPVRRHLMGSFVVEVVVALVAASVRIFTPMAFGILVPTYGLALMGLWGARHGTFADRIIDDPRMARRVVADKAPKSARGASGVGKNGRHG